MPSRKPITYCFYYVAICWHGTCISITLKIKKPGSWEGNMLIKSDHFIKRQGQRGLKKNVLDFILEYAEIRYARRATWLVIVKKKLPRNLKTTSLAKQAAQWLVIMRDGILITCYRNNNPLRHLSCSY